MNQNWENKFRTWAQSPSKSEEERSENAENAIRKAIAASQKLKSRDVKVFTQGSYRNRTHVKQDSDVDIGVVCFESFFPDYPEGMTHESFGNRPATYHYAQFKNEVEEALVGHFGNAAVKRGNKAFDIRENTYHLEADVAPFFEHRRYSPDGNYLSGVELKPDNGQPEKVINWPEQHYDNGNEKNKQTSRRYRALVRVLKNLQNEMSGAGVSVSKPIVGFLSECLVWNVPNSNFRNVTYWDDLRDALIFLYQNTETNEKCAEWGEVSELKYLFRGSQKWTRQQAHEFILAAWRHVGFS